MKLQIKAHVKFEIEIPTLKEIKDTGDYKFPDHYTAEEWHKHLEETAVVEKIGGDDRILEIYAVETTLYTFHRNDENQAAFYPLELTSDEEARVNARCNPGTTKVINQKTGAIVWPVEESNES